MLREILCRTLDSLRLRFVMVANESAKTGTLRGFPGFDGGRFVRVSEKIWGKLQQFWYTLRAIICVTRA